MVKSKKELWNSKAIEGAGTWNGASLAGAGIYNQEGLKGAGIYNQEGLKGAGIYNQEALNGAGLFNEAGLRGAGLYNQEGLAGAGCGCGLYNNEAMAGAGCGCVSGGFALLPGPASEWLSKSPEEMESIGRQKYLALMQSGNNYLKPAEKRWLRKEMRDDGHDLWKCIFTAFLIDSLAVMIARQVEIINTPGRSRAEKTRARANKRQFMSDLKTVKTEVRSRGKTRKVNYIQRLLRTSGAPPNVPSHFITDNNSDWALIRPHLNELNVPRVRTDPARARATRAAKAPRTAGKVPRKSKALKSLSLADIGELPPPPKPSSKNPEGGACFPSEWQEAEEKALKQKHFQTHPLLLSRKLNYPSDYKPSTIPIGVATQHKLNSTGVTYSADNTFGSNFDYPSKYDTSQIKQQPASKEQASTQIAASAPQPLTQAVTTEQNQQRNARYATLGQQSSTKHLQKETDEANAAFARTIAAYYQSKGMKPPTSVPELRLETKVDPVTKKSYIVLKLPPSISNDYAAAATQIVQKMMPNTPITTIKSDAPSTIQGKPVPPPPPKQPLTPQTVVYNVSTGVGAAPANIEGVPSATALTGDTSIRTSSGVPNTAVPVTPASTDGEPTAQELAVAQSQQQAQAAQQTAEETARNAAASSSLVQVAPAQIEDGQTALPTPAEASPTSLTTTAPAAKATSTSNITPERNVTLDSQQTPETVAVPTPTTSIDSASAKDPTIAVADAQVSTATDTEANEQFKNKTKELQTNPETAAASEATGNIVQPTGFDTAPAAATAAAAPEINNPDAPANPIKLGMTEEEYNKKFQEAMDMLYATLQSTNTPEYQKITPEALQEYYLSLSPDEIKVRILPLDVDDNRQISDLLDDFLYQYYYDIYRLIENSPPAREYIKHIKQLVRSNLSSDVPFNEKYIEDTLISMFRSTAPRPPLYSMWQNNNMNHLTKSFVDDFVRAYQLKKEEKAATETVAPEVKQEMEEKVKKEPEAEKDVKKEPETDKKVKKEPELTGTPYPSDDEAEATTATKTPQTKVEPTMVVYGDEDDENPNISKDPITVEFRNLAKQALKDIKAATPKNKTTEYKKFLSALTDLLQNKYKYTNFDGNGRKDRRENYSVALAAPSKSTETFYDHIRKRIENGLFGPSTIDLKNEAKKDFESLLGIPKDEVDAITNGSATSSINNTRAITLFLAMRKITLDAVYAYLYWMLRWNITQAQANGKDKKYNGLTGMGSLCGKKRANKSSLPVSKRFKF